MDALAQLVGQSTGLAAVRDQVRRLLEHQSEFRRMPPVLIQGETGSGKGLIARAMHGASARASGPFVDVNCAAIPETLLEAEMFGVERGAFTDARHAKPGLLQLAHRGTIFLDEIGLLPESLQVKLLKAIEERAVRRLGGTRTEPVDVWVVAATNDDLVAATRDRRFRADLYHRLAVVTITLPPLRERGEDVVLLGEHFLARACADYGMAPKTLTSAAKAALSAYSWPGNVRELSNVMERVALLGEGVGVTPEMLALPAAPAEAPRQAAAEPRTLDAAVDDVEREHLLAALRETDWNVTRAARRLGISRNTLRYRIEKHGLRPGTAPPRRRVGAPPRPAGTPRVASAGATPASPAGVASGQRERRRLALMRAVLSVPPGADAAFVSGRALQLLSDKARAFGGHVEEVTAAGIVAAFGVEPVEDAPVRAANAALAIVNGLDRARRNEALNVGVKAAIHVDHFLVTPPGPGPAIDMEARPHAWAFLDGLLGSAEPDGIVTSEAAVQFLERRFELLPATGGYRVDGRVFRLAGRERLAVGVQGRTAAFVGRYHEFALLHSRFESAVRGHGQAIGIAGEAGIGKSRLVHEFRRSLAGQTVLCLEGRCHSYTTEVAYSPVLDVVRAACRIVEADTPARMAAKVAEALRDVGMEPATGAAHLLHLLGVKEGAERLGALTPDEIKSRVVETLRQFVVRSSQLRPLIVVVEDLHWIDAASEDFLASLADVVVGARLLLVSTYRPGYRPPWIGRSYATQMALQPLDSEAGKAIVRSALGSAVVDDAVLDMILAKGEGNAFFLEELARAVGEVGVGEAALGVPATVRDVLLARIDRLPPVEKHVLQCAAVIGKDAPLAIVRAIAGLPEDTLRESLGRLRSAELVYETGIGRDAEFTFKHALTHEVAYESVLEPRRRELHAAIVQAIESQGAGPLGDQAERLAHHAFLGEAWDKAAQYLRQAAAKAAVRSGHREAVAGYERALLALGRLPETRSTLELRIDLRFDLRVALQPLGDFEPMLAHLQAAEQAAKRLDDRRRLALALAYLTDYWRLMGDQNRALASGEQALALAEALEDLSLKVHANTYLGQVNYARGDYRRARAFFMRNVTVLVGDLTRETFGSPQPRSVHSRTCLAWSLAEMGEFAEGIVHGDEALRIAEMVEQPMSIATACSGLGHVYLRKGDLARAIAALERALEYSRTWNIRLWFPRVASALGVAYAVGGRVAEAVPLLEDAVEQARAMRLMGNHALHVGSLAEGYLRAGRLREAREAGERALALAREHDEGGHEGWAHSLLASVALASQPADVSGAQLHGREAIARAAALGMRPLLAHAELALGRACRLAADRAGAEEHVKTAAAIFRELEMPLGSREAQTEVDALG